MRKGIGGLSVMSEDGRLFLDRIRSEIWFVYVIAEHKGVYGEWGVIVYMVNYLNGICSGGVS
jgi:hypothetical protein